MLIVNADDLGYSPSVNRAVLEAMALGYCSTATIMPNMPGFDEACQLLHEGRLAHRVGVHWVVTEGRPLTDRMRACRRFCDADGVFTLTRDRRVIHLETEDREALFGELAAQLDRCTANGLEPKHADSHRHAHEEWAIASVAIAVCRTEGIRWLRVARNMGRSTGACRSMYRRMLNWRIRRRGLARTRFFGSWEDYKYHTLHAGGCDGPVEIMIHPNWGSDGLLLDATCGAHLTELPGQACRGEE